MDQGIAALSEREKEALRLLLRGYDAKSIARELDLSVHTVNERLRDARRKLGVSSSREAARQLADAQQTHPNSFADKEFGVGRPHENVVRREHQHRGAGPRLAWLGGGMLIMSLIVAAAALSSAFHAGNSAQSSTSAAAVNAPDPAAVSSAREWASLLDRQQWAASWNAAGAIFKSRLPETDWASKIQTVRGPLGAASSRVIQSLNKATSLPGAPDGEYEIVQFQTNFAHKQHAIETVVLAHELSGWKVDGYFIR
jgi:DNA-binding CsgD family transcriptional regulator